MAILNYTTQISADKTFAEIQSILSRAKAQSVMSEFDEDGVLSIISFRIQTPQGLMYFKLPANVQKVYQVIVRDKRIANKLRTREQAARVAWRIVKDWLEAQMAFVQTEQVDIAQLFLPYAMSPTSGLTVYEMLQDRKFDLLLPAPGDCRT